MVRFLKNMSWEIFPEIPCHKVQLAEHGVRFPVSSSFAYDWLQVYETSTDVGKRLVSSRTTDRRIGIDTVCFVNALNSHDTEDHLGYGIEVHILNMNTFLANCHPLPVQNQTPDTADYSHAKCSPSGHHVLAERAFSLVHSKWMTACSKHNLL